jgi:hypothetical protein
MTWYVYALCDPDTFAIRYIGKSSNPAKRLAAHRSDSASTPIREWLASLGAEPNIRILEESATETGALVLEHGWVAQLTKQGVVLLNGVPGGRTPPRKRKGPFDGIGTRVRLARMGMGLSQTALAEAAGLCDGPKISRLESGKRTKITAETAVLIARALDVSVEWLVTGEERASHALAAE